MPWSPSFENALPDPRLNPYRSRAAVATLYGEPAGHLLVHTDFLAEQVSGRLWWRRWRQPTEFVELFSRLGDHEVSQRILPADLDALVAQWADGTHTTGGTTYGLTWLDEAGSQRVHREVFGHQH